MKITAVIPIRKGFRRVPNKDLGAFADTTLLELKIQTLLHSDKGVEMAVAYHSVISAVKLHGMSCWRYLGELFQKIFNGCQDLLSLTPANIGMAYANC